MNGVPPTAATGSRLSLDRYALSAGPFLDREVLGRRLQQRLELRAVGRVLVLDPNRRDHVRFHAARQVALDPIALRPDDAVLLVVPADEPAGAEPAGVGGEVPFHGAERQAELCRISSCRIGVTAGFSR